MALTIPVNSQPYRIYTLVSGTHFLGARGNHLLPREDGRPPSSPATLLPRDAPRVTVSFLIQERQSRAQPHSHEAHFVWCLSNARLVDRSPYPLIHSSIRCSHVYTVTRSCVPCFYCCFYVPVLCADVCTCISKTFFLVAVNIGSKHELPENFVYDYRVNFFFVFLFCLRSLAVRKHYFRYAIAAKEST